jgi:hypothetical protein
MLDFSGFDICVLDFAPNDAAELEGGNTPVELVHSVVSDAVRRVLEQGCLPALLVLPIRSQFLANTGKTICGIYKDVASVYNVPLFDGYQYIRRLKARAPNGQHLFNDNMHLRADVAIAMCEAFVPRLLEAHGQRIPQPSIRGSGFTYDYLDLDNLGLGPAPTRRRRTGIFETRTASLSGTFDVTLAGFETGEITAIGVDWANSAGSLTISGSTSSTKRLTTQYSEAGTEDTGRLIFGISTVNPRVPFTGGSVAMEVHDDARRPGRLELGALVVRRMAEFSVRPLLPSPVIWDQF